MRIAQARVVCCPGRWALLCALDSLNHVILPRKATWLCDWHEHVITGEWPR